jgi:putative transposase
MRGVDGRKIFMDDEDRWYSVFGLYEFNTIEAIRIRRQREKREKFKKELKSRQGPASAKLGIEQPDKRIRLVDILAFALMPNHIHLLLKQLIPNGISSFVQKFGTGRAMHFNKRHERKGTLFQSRFDARHIDSDEYLKTAFVYIHTNPISLIEPGWKEKGIVDLAKAKEFLETYRWSSYPDYLGKKNFPSITERDFVFKAMGGPEGVRLFVDYWLDYKHYLSGKSAEAGPWQS